MSLAQNITISGQKQRVFLWAIAARIWISDGRFPYTVQKIDSQITFLIWMGTQGVLSMGLLRTGGIQVSYNRSYM